MCLSSGLSCLKGSCRPFQLERLNNVSDKFVPVSGCYLCQVVRYEVDVNLSEGFYCHCKTCQKTSGAPASVGVMAKPGTLRFTKEDPKYFQSSPIGSRGFCQHCGSRLTWVSPDREDWIVVFAGSLAQPEHVVPIEHIREALIY